VHSKRFRITALAGATYAAMGAALLILAAAPPRERFDTPTQLSAIVQASLSQAPANFAAWRTGAKTADSDGVSFKASAALLRICPLCSVADEFASADSDERYTVTFNWLVLKSWSRAQTVALIQQRIGELLPKFTIQQGTTDDGESWFDWTKASPKEFVYVVTFSGSTGNGFEVRVGHYLPKSLHYTKYARLSAAQRTDLTNAVRNFVQLGVQNASNDFASLRGHATDKDNNYFDANVSFGEFMTRCVVDGIFASESTSGGTSKWILECDTPSLGGSKSDVEAIIQSAIVNALPGGFTSTTDPTYLGISDYRWDRSSDTIAVEVSSNDNHDGTLDYNIYIYHFKS
jgi:hypothetical protein